MLRIVRTERTLEVYNDDKRIFLETIGDSGAWGECSSEHAERSMKGFLKCWGVEEDASVQEDL